MNKHPAKQVHGRRTYQVATLVVALPLTLRARLQRDIACKTAMTSLLSSDWACRL